MRVSLRMSQAKPCGHRDLAQLSAHLSLIHGCMSGGAQRVQRAEESVPMLQETNGSLTMAQTGPAGLQHRLSFQQLKLLMTAYAPKQEEMMPPRHLPAPAAGPGYYVADCGT